MEGTRFMLPITIVITNRYSDWEIGPLAGLGAAFYKAEITFASPEGGPVTSVAGLPIADTARFKAPEAGIVVVCGSPLFETDSPPDIDAELLKSRENGCIIAGICGGTTALARAGLLNDVRHTSNGLEYLQKLAKGYSGSASYVDQPAAIRDGDIITAPAPAPATFAKEVLMAAGLDQKSAEQIPQMLSREHSRSQSAVSSGRKAA
jgi:putative intracellular protease/amidase